ncbi:MAG: hypothetical protein LBH41_02845 [Rickettsiales bacterium]|jgi:hypothetical protein|nr:hypothetical protein [Rickettsiales bacterium]
MKFKLIYNGEVKINPKRRTQHLDDIRTALSPQLRRLTEIAPYSVIREKLVQKGRGIREVGGAKFFPIITPELNLLADLDVQILHPELLETPHADIDNRMKTLLDALKRPQGPHEVCNTHNGEIIYTLLDDDHLVTRMNINTSHLLDPCASGCGRGSGPGSRESYELLIIIGVSIRASKGTMDNLAIIV